MIVDHVVKNIAGEEVSLSTYRGKVLLVVNTASACGLTPQYKGLQELYAQYKDKGLEVLGFPCNDFGAQEPGSHEEIQSFCDLRFGVTFPLFAKVNALGDKSPLYRDLTENTAEEFQGEIRWNFTKFLISGAGEVIARFEPTVEPGSDEVKSAIDAALEDL